MEISSKDFFDYTRDENLLKLANQYEKFQQVYHFLKDQRSQNSLRYLSVEDVQRLIYYKFGYIIST